MPDWLYQFFGQTVGLLIFSKHGRHLAKPCLFTEGKDYAPASFWIHPPKPVMSPSTYHFDPPTLYRPHIFLWLLHFYVHELQCPNCTTGTLEKNSVLSPRRITDIEDNFYIVAWEYYCCKGCRSHFHGWSQKLLSTLPAYLWLAFPATLSY